jgi:hypothetical protein
MLPLTILKLRTKEASSTLRVSPPMQSNKPLNNNLDEVLNMSLKFKNNKYAQGVMHSKYLVTYD